MSRNDIIPKESGGVNSLAIDRFVVASGTPITIKAGEPTKAGVQNATGGIILLADADLVIGTTRVFTGVAAIDSTEISTASGYVDTYVPLPSVKFEIKAKTAANVDTQSEIDALLFTSEIIDLTSSVFTMDVANGSVSTAAFVIVGGDKNRSTVHFRVRAEATYFGRAAI